jgi:hypothetical protein
VDLGRIVSEDQAEYLAAVLRKLGATVRTEWGHVCEKPEDHDPEPRPARTREAAEGRVRRCEGFGHGARLVVHERIDLPWQEVQAP